jgi:hypothetical protein
MRPVYILFLLAGFAAPVTTPALAAGPDLSAITETAPTPPVAEYEPRRIFLGTGRLFTNDQFGDGNDRWRTGAFQFSLLRGREGLTRLPQRFGELVEFRFGAMILAPSNLTNPDPADRRYAGVLSFGLHSHFMAGGTEFSLGAGLAVTGPQTGLDRFHSQIHRALGMVPPSPATLAAQIPNGFHPTALGEAGQRFALGDKVAFRPFIEAQAGVTTFVRVGGDLLIGSAYSKGVWVRDAGTGQLYQSLGGAGRSGMAFTLGADIARVFSSVYLPSSGGYQFTPARVRARAGISWQGEKVGLFYGVTWLGRKFEAQPKGQILGSLQIRIEF